MLELKNISRVYTDGEETTALKDISLKINDGEFVAIVGPSALTSNSIYLLRVKYKDLELGLQE